MDVTALILPHARPILAPPLGHYRAPLVPLGGPGCSRPNAGLLVPGIQVQWEHSGVDGIGEGTATPGCLPTPELQRDASVSCRGRTVVRVSAAACRGAHAAVVGYAPG